MKLSRNIFRKFFYYILFSFFVILLAQLTDHAVSTYHLSKPYVPSKTFIIDAGHGGVDGGAISCTGVLESNINLEISLRLNDMMHLLGLSTAMIRTKDISVYTEGNSISSKKISDLKERLRIIHNTPGAILLSIHQNHFTDPRYSGAQVFFAHTTGSRQFAEVIQATMQYALYTDRSAKKVDNIYLMRNVECPAILIECGFISNPQEEKKLLDMAYQKKICAIIAAVCAGHYEQFELSA